MFISEKKSQFSIISFFLIVFSFNIVNSAVITVPASYSTIQEAINAASAGDTVEVSPGTYIENITINKSLNLVAANLIEPVIDGGGIGVVVNITADNVNMSGFEVVSGAIGILIYYANFVSISDNIISNIIGEDGADGSTGQPGKTAAGIYLENSNNSVVITNEISQVSGGDGGSSSSNSAYGGKGGTAVGIYILSSDNSNITSNTINAIYGGNRGTSGPWQRRF